MTEDDGLSERRDSWGVSYLTLYSDRSQMFFASRSRLVHRPRVLIPPVG